MVQKLYFRYPKTCVSFMFVGYAIALLLTLSLWNTYLRQPLLQTNASILASNQLLEQKISTVSSIKNIPRSRQFKSSNLKNLTTVSKDVQAALNNTGNLILLDIKQNSANEVAPSDAFSTDLTEQSRLIKMEFTIQLSGNYQDILSFFANLNAHNSFFFWKTLDYKVLSYPQALATCTFTAYGKK